MLEAPGIPAIRRCELYNKYRPLVPQPFRDKISPKPPQEVLDHQKITKNEKVRAKAHAKKRKPAKTEKETTEDEKREDGKEEIENVEQQVAAAPAAVEQQVAEAAAAASLVLPVVPWIPTHPFNPNTYLYGGFHPFNSFNSNL
jgi:hypothetical protein